ncbi:DNA mismatch repair protein MSH3 [Artomyces pyxidatus]|uniref:DNA mismatch repair protein MSH3 n=1 Tax=Artomyces pyxidatus TaxID=48021 RepID=A0ACB8STM8_9AGAM|nr:DNA mismatch repair protein MSH3 [Artomyces pyxidatus]
MPGVKSRKFVPLRQPMISHFFAQPSSKPAHNRSSSPIDLTLSDSDERPAKRQKTSSHVREQLFLAPSPSPEPQAGPSYLPSVSPTRPAGTADRWRYDPSSSQGVEPQLTAQEEFSISTRRKKLAKKLMLENNPFLKMQSPLEVGDEEVMGGDAESRSDSGDESDGKFKELQEMFSHSGKGRKKKPKTKTAPAKPVKRVEEIGPSGESYTPLEQQVRALKAQHPDVLLMIEVGYKVRFFGEDARIASKELGIVCFPDRNFLVASIPTHRRDVHLKKLLSKGHKVGIVDQIETAALKKVSDNRNAPFERKLTHLYTAVTYVDELGSVDETDQSDAPLLMCLVEEPRGGLGMDEKVNVGMIVICPSTGDVVWDEFDGMTFRLRQSCCSRTQRSFFLDGHMRTEVETRMVHTKPAELLLAQKKLTKPTERMLNHFSGNATTEHSVRIERYSGTMTYTEAFDFVSAFYTSRTKSAGASEGFTSGRLMAAVTDFPQQVVIALAQCIKYLSAFDIADALLATKFFGKFTTRAHMLLNGNTLSNLEIYRNETDFTAKGSLMWILDHTTTKFGSRLLRNWVGKPLVDMPILQERTDAVEEIVSSPSMKLIQLRQLLKGLPDLSKGLCRIQYGKCTPQELAALLTAFNKVATAFTAVDTPAEVGFKSTLLNNIISSLPPLREPVQELIASISLKRAEEGKKSQMWTDPERYPEVSAADMGVQAVEFELADQLKIIRKILKKPSLQWTTVSEEEYLIEISKADDQSSIPHNWIYRSGTKKVRRYWTPTVKGKIEERARYQEMLDMAAQQALLSFLDEIAQKHYALLRDAVNKLAIADCLISLAQVAVNGDYVKPQFTDEADVLEIVDGRHPMVEALRSEPFVPNSLSIGRARSKIITGPNMGGKSSSVRMIALIAIMAQIGSYVPAKSVKLSMLDGVLTRMGASDELARGRSTFMVEMSETSDILLHATDKSLVILDELGRGTSTFDGMAIAQAVLQHLVQVKKCKTLFITHYPLVATDLARQFPRDVENLHMGFTEDTRITGVREITFLYRLTAGVATESFGIECARLAGIPEDVLETAGAQAERMRRLVELRHRRNKARKAVGLIGQCMRGSTDALEELRAVVGSLSAKGDTA